MPELTFKSAGVSTREIDLSGPSGVAPSGVPAGIIGTANRGPAFVPVVVGTLKDFVAEFGKTDAEKFGPLAVVEWLTNAKAVTYLRVLGAGNGKTKASDGKVTNAGFVVGAKQVQAAGSIAANPYANSNGVLGRTYFLGCFMSESNHSTALSAPGVQTTAVSSMVQLTIDRYASAKVDAGVVFHDGMGNVYSASINSSKTNEASTSRAIGYSGVNSAAKLARSLWGSIQHAIDYGVAASSTGSASGNKLRMSANYVAGSATVQLTSSIGGPVGNVSITGHDLIGGATPFISITGSQGSSSGFDGGTGGSTPIIRGVLLAPSGVCIMLSGSQTGKAGVNQTPAKTTIATAAGPVGGVTGSVNIRNGKQEFVVLLNGHKGSGKYKRVLTASFDPDAGNYISNVFNTDPLQTEAAGHLLYAHWDIHPAMAVPTGSGVLVQGATEENGAGAAAGLPIYQDCAFILTGALGRNANASNKAPNYEGFETRYRAPRSPWVVSQKFGGVAKNLFKIHSRDDGVYANHLFKISIEGLRNSTSNTEKYGRFDLLVRDFNDTDTDRVVLEQFRGLSLNPMSDRYISRVIGDKSSKFDFDKKLGAQKLVYEGEHPNNSSYIRIEVADDVIDGIINDIALPVGFRGPHHLVTSGTECLNIPVSNTGTLPYTTTYKRSQTLPIPYREDIKVGRPPKEQADSAYYWGVQFEMKDNVLETNKSTKKNPGMKNYTRYLPGWQETYQAAWVGDNSGKAASTYYGELDSDKFQNNLFTLENIKVRTGSSGLADVKQWHSASYVRAGGIQVNASKKTRGFSVADDLGDSSVRKYAKFTFFLQGGFDGVNIFDEAKTKFENVAIKREMDDTNQGESDGPTVSAYDKALDIMSTKSDVDIKLLALPGVRHEQITNKAIEAVENRFDALYIMDVEERDVDNKVITGSIQDPGVNNTVTAFKDRGLDTSFAAAYFPDVTIRDPFMNVNVQVPPSVAVLGAFSLNDNVAHPWFAPAGFTRGALDPRNEGRTVAVNLSRANLDTIYESDINPLTSFPGSDGIVVWGQKTLLAAQSSLDRVNVRRLLIEIRRQVRLVGNRILFEPNRESTLAKFSSAVQPILTRIQEQQGLDRFKVVIDTTTTTQADVENNTLRGKIFLQPTRVAEFISLDFVITNAGAEV
jgi:phage tail sheath protein FI